MCVHIWAIMIYLTNTLINTFWRLYYSTDNSATDNQVVSGTHEDTDESSSTPNGKKPKKNKKEMWSTILGRTGVSKDLADYANRILESGQTPRASDINYLQNTLITQENLDSWLCGPSVKYTEITDESKKSILKSLRKGSSISTTNISGIYIWQYKPTGQQYVGSSIQLPVRLRNYFSHTVVENGKLLPLFYNTPITEWSLEIIFTPLDLTIRPELSLEQYFLLNPNFNLNTIRVANNPSGSNAKSLFMYNRDQTILYFSSTKQIDFINLFNINHTTFTKHLNNGTYYLGKYRFTREIVSDVILANLSTFDLQNMLEGDRVFFNRNKPISSLSTSVVLINNAQIKMCFYSLGEAVRHLQSLGFVVSQKTLVKRLDTGVIYCDHLCYRAPLFRSKIGKKV